MKQNVFVAAAFAVVACAQAAMTYRLDDFVWENRDPARYHVPSVPIKDFKPGMRAEVTMWVDASGLSETGVPEASLAWGDRKTGSGWAQGSSTVKRWKDKNIEKDAKGRRKFVCSTVVMPSNGTKPRLHFFAKKPATGKIVYSDIVVTLFPRTFQMLMSNDAYRGAAAEGNVRFAVAFVTDPENEKPDADLCAFVYRGADGHEFRRVPDKLTNEMAEDTVPVAELAMGVQDVRFELAIAGKKVETVTCPFERLAKPVKRRVMFDTCGRTRVNGKPFFPIGMYWSEDTLARTNALERYVAPGVFNCLQTYEKAMSPEILDRYWAKNLMVMASVKDIYLPKADGTRVAFLPPGIKTKADETAYVTKIVNRCKDHPALLAWYTSDELDDSHADLLEERYRLLKELDPDHPVYVLAFENSTRRLLHSYDVTGEDCYSVCEPHADPKNAEQPGMGNVWQMADHADLILDGMLRLRPLWQITQAFKWQWDHKDRWDCRFPTRRELSSQTWQQVAVGANGIFFYSYGQMNRKNVLESELIEYFDETTVPVARELKAVEDILVLDPGPAVTAKPARVRVRTWRKPGSWFSGDETYALVCNCRPETRTGEVVVAGEWSSCEPVFGSGVTLKNGKLVLDMRPIATAMVRLR